MYTAGLSALGFVGKKADSTVQNLVNSWLAKHAPGKAGNEGEFHLPPSKGAQPIEPVARSGYMNNGQIVAPGMQQPNSGGPGVQLHLNSAGMQYPNSGGPGIQPNLNSAGMQQPNSGAAGAAMMQNNQYPGAQQQKPLGSYRGPALNIAGRR